MYCLLEIYSERTTASGKENIPIFNEVYILFNQNHMYNTRESTIQMLVVPQVKTTHNEKHSFKSKLINAWNLCQRNL